MDPDVDSPCNICPNGATAGHAYIQPFAGAEETKTCKELLDDLVDLCESIREIDAMCCVDVDSTPSPVEPLTTSPPGTMAKSPTDPSSGRIHFHRF